MNTMLLTPKGPITSSIRALQEAVRQSQPLRGSGTLYRQTVDGVIRSARRRKATTSSGSETQRYVPEWG